MVVALELLAAFVLIIGGAIGFTNAVEWLGHRLNLGAGAVGAILAAVGTALPESVIPVVALVGSGGDQESVDIAIGAIIGAPFLLGTLAMLLVAGSALLFRGRRAQGAEVTIDPPATRRDLRFFLALFPAGVLLGVLPTSAGVQIAGAVALVGAYALYTVHTIRSGGDADLDDDLVPLYFDSTRRDPPSTAQIVVQFVAALAAIIVGAELFVRGIESIAESLEVSPLILSLILAPLATEMPEKANSVLWVRQGKDVLALGNITGAMAFQATIPVALGLLLTSWELDRFAVAASLAGYAGGVLALWAFPRRRVGVAAAVVWGLLCSGFVAYAVTG